MKIDVERRIVDLGREVSYMDYGGEGSPIVLVHGLGGSVENWMLVGRRLAGIGHVIALDLYGFGHTPLPDAVDSNADRNQELVSRFIAELDEGPSVLIGNSFGGMVSVLQAAAEPDSVASLVLVDPVLPHPSGTEVDPVVDMLFATYATPALGEFFISSRLAEIGPAETVRMTMALCCADAGRIAAETLDAHIALSEARMQMPWSTKAFLDSARSLMELMFDDRYARALETAPAPALIVQGALDRLVPLAAARALAELRPDWELVVMPDTGHIPMLEVPEEFLGAVEPWLHSLLTDAR
jgi:pimeloyl-ACP methyl ester carboxylesterase